MADKVRLIDANALLGKLSRMIEYCKTDSKVNGLTALFQVGDAVMDCPTVDAVEVVHGRWLFDSNTERCFCSVCNEEALYTSKDDPIFDYDWEENLRYSHTETILEEHLTNYCPNCGAKMRGSEE